jgi:hypothetical protein
LVIAHLLHRDIPSLYRVALRAVRTHLAAMDVRVAISAVFPDVWENRFYLTLCALHFFVHAGGGSGGTGCFGLWACLFLPLEPSTGFALHVRLTEDGAEL